jgi:type IV secretory pathway VirB10-like protein
MKKQLVAGAIVFCVGFGIGLGLTYLLLSKQPTDADTPDPVHAEAVSQANPVVSSPSTEKTPAPGTDDSKTPPATEPAKPDGAAQPAAPADPSSAPQSPEPQKKPGAIDAPADESDPSLDQPAEPKWWEGLKGKVCKVDLGNARALIIRQGGVKDGEVINWSDRFGRNPRIGLMAKGELTGVLVHGVGISRNGDPTAAMITVEKQGRKTTGIIALHTQGLRVSLNSCE